MQSGAIVVGLMIAGVALATWAALGGGNKRRRPSKVEVFAGPREDSKA